MSRLAVVLAAALLLSATGADTGGPTPCEQAYETLLADVIKHRMDGEAERTALVRRLDVLAARFGSETSACTIGIARKRANLTNLSGLYAETVAHAEHAVPLGGRVPFPDETSSLYQEWANALVQLGRTVEARRVYAAAARLVPRLNFRSAMLVLRAAAAQAQNEGDWALSEATIDRALAFTRDSMDTRPEYMRVTYGRLLGTKSYLLQQIAAETADPEYRRRIARQLVAVADTSLKLMEAHETDDPVEQEFDQGRQALALIDVAYADAVLGDHARAAGRLDAAWRLLTPVAQDIFPDAVPDYWLRRAETQEMDGDLDAAAESAERSLAACDADANLDCQAAAIETMARVAEATGRTSDAERLYRRAVEMHDITWEQQRFQDWSASAFASSRSSYSGLARTLARQGRARDGFLVLDGARARALRDIRTRREARERITPDHRQQTDSLLAVVHGQRIRLVEPGLLPEKRRVLEDSVDQGQARIAEIAGQTSALPEPLDISALQRTLGAQRRTLVSYIVGTDSTTAFVVSADTLVVRTVPATFSSIAREMRAAGGTWAPDGADPAIRLAPLNRLYDALVAPIAALIRDGDGLVVIPDGPLADLPFGMLVEAPAQDYASARFLIRSRAVSTDLAASLIVEDAGRAEDPFDLDLVAFGRSRFDGAGGTFRSRSGPLLANLPYVVGEIESVGARVGNREAAMDDDATETEFNATAGRARIVHVASHAEADPQYPLNSRIFLWDSPGADDGIVHLFELQDLSIHADLVVLSGCSTAAGQAQPGEGTIGLQYGVRAAGARASVATLWPVDDRATASIVDAFYAGIAEGLPKDVALQRAQVAYIDAHSGAEASPYLWAATILSGSPAPVPIHAPRPVWPWVAGALALGAGGLAWRSRRRPTDA